MIPNNGNPHGASTRAVPGLARSAPVAAPGAPASAVDVQAIDNSGLAAFTGGGLSLGETQAADAQMALATAIIRSSVQVNKLGLVEAVFLEQYCGSWGTQLVDRILELKPHQNPGALRKMRDALKALSLFEFMGKIQVSLGGGK